MALMALFWHSKIFGKTNMKAKKQSFPSFEPVPSLRLAVADWPALADTVSALTVVRDGGLPNEAQRRRLRAVIYMLEPDLWYQDRDALIGKVSGFYGGFMSTQAEELEKDLHRPSRARSDRPRFAMLLELRWMMGGRILKKDSLRRIISEQARFPASLRDSAVGEN